MMKNSELYEKVKFALAASSLEMLIAAKKIALAEGKKLVVAAIEEEIASRAS